MTRSPALSSSALSDSFEKSLQRPGKGGKVPSAWLVLSPACFWTCCSHRVCKHHLKTLVVVVVIFMQTQTVTFQKKSHKSVWYCNLLHEGHSKGPCLGKTSLSPSSFGSLILGKAVQFLLFSHHLGFKGLTCAPI